MRYGKSFLVVLSAAVLAIQGCGDGGGQSLGGSKSTGSDLAASVSEKLSVTEWGPKETEQGVVFNKQPNGKSALWVIVSGVREHQETRITFDGKPMEDIAVTDKVVTGAAPLSFIEAPGPKEIVIEEGGTGRRVVVGTFSVKPRASH